MVCLKNAACEILFKPPAWRLQCDNKVEALQWFILLL